MHAFSPPKVVIVILLGQVRFFSGRKLDYEPKHYEKNGAEKDFITAIEFSAEDPYGIAVALLNIKSGFVKVICLERLIVNIRTSSCNSFGWSNNPHFSFFLDRHIG